MFNWTDIRKIRRLFVPPLLNFMAIIFILLCSWWILSEKMTIQWIDVNATFHSVIFQSDTASKSCQTQYLTTICNPKRHFKLRALVCGCCHFQKILIWMVCSKCWVCYSMRRIVHTAFFFFTHNHFIDLKVGKKLIYSFWLQKGVKNSTR